MIYNDSDSMVADIAIVGGGPSGLVLAAVCERLGLDYVVYERSAKETTPRGGCLDLHHGSGQRAMREAGVYAEFQKHARGGSSSVHAVFDHHCNQVFSWGEGRDSPEIDRHEIKAALLTGIPNGKIEWRKGVESASRDEFGYIILKFVDGSTVTGFKLVVGADGTFSKVRPLVRGSHRVSTLLCWSANVTPDRSHCLNPDIGVWYSSMVRSAKQMHSGKSCTTRVAKVRWLFWVDRRRFGSSSKARASIGSSVES